MNHQQRVRDLIAAKKEAMEKTFKAQIDQSFAEVEQEVGVIVSELESKHYVRVRIGESVEDAFASLLSTGGTIGLDRGNHYANLVNPRRPPGAPKIVFTTHELTLPEQRVTRDHVEAMALLFARDPLRAAFYADIGSRSVGFLNMGYGPQARDRTVVELGHERRVLSRVEDIPEDFDFTRVLWLGDPVLGQHAGARLNAARVSMSQCAMYDMHEAGRDSQCLTMWNGTRHVLIDDCFFEGAGENVLIGGADCASIDMIPQDIVFQNMHLSKNRAWMLLAQQPNVKCLFEVKNAKRVRVTGGVMEKNWAKNWPTGQAIAVKAANQENSNPYAACEDVTIEDVIVRDCGSVATFVAKCDAGNHTDRMRRVTVRNLLAYNINKGDYRGTGRAFWSTNTPDGLTLDRITVVDNGHSAHDGEVNGHNAEAPAAEAPILLSLTNSLVRESDYGFRTLDALYGSRRVITNNVLAKSPANRSLNAPGNAYVSEADYAKSFDADYRVIPGSPVDVAAGKRASTEVPVGAQTGPVAPSGVRVG